MDEFEEYQKPENESDWVELGVYLGVFFAIVILVAVAYFLSKICLKKVRKWRMKIIAKEQDETPKNNELVPVKSQVSVDNEVVLNVIKNQIHPNVNPVLGDEKGRTGKETQNESEFNGIQNFEVKFEKYQQATIQQLTEEWNKITVSTKTELGELKDEIKEISKRITKLETKKPSKHEMETKVSRLIGEVNMLKDSLESFYCKYCGATFGTTYGLKTHLKSKHNKLPTDDH